MDDHSIEWEKERKSHSARCGHVRRCILSGTPMSKKVRDFALAVIESSRDGFSDMAFLDGIARKLEQQAPLSEYEGHIMVDVLLPHSRLKGRL